MWLIPIPMGRPRSAAIAAKAPDMVILDVMLPNRSGYDILRDLRAGERTTALPVLMLTARGQKKDREMAERLWRQPLHDQAVLQCRDGQCGG